MALQRSCNLIEFFYRNVDLSSLDTPHITAIKATKQRKSILGNALLLSFLPDFFTEFFRQILHCMLTTHERAIFSFDAYMATDYNPHFLSDGRKMKASKTFSIDTVLYELIQQKQLQSFSVLQLRELYMQRVDIGALDTSRLRMYLYDHIRRLVRVGWVRPDAEKRKREQLFHLIDQPQGLLLKFTKPAGGVVAHVREDSDDRQADKTVSGELVADMHSPIVDNTDSPLMTLESMLKEAQLDFLTSYGEAEKYTKLIEQIPSLEGALRGDLVRARDNSSKLLGHIKALETAIRHVG